MEGFRKYILFRLLMRIKVDIWIPRSAIASMVKEADAHFPKETGGVLMGYFNRDKSIAVITDVIGPGLRSIHRRYSFVPDYEYQEKRIAEIYFKAGRLHTYLGDWHTHPGGNTSLSLSDRKALESIAVHKEARAPFPIMILLAGGPYKWEIKQWQLKQKRLLRIVFANNLIDLNKKIY
jgi:integrative and conjugative element protein (TIGR02256 family)